MKPLVRLGCLAIMSLPAWPTLPAGAHHSPAQFDLTRDAFLEGTVREYDWRNPHVYIALEVAGPDGRTVMQNVEVGSAASLATLGFDGNSLQAGDRVSIQVKPNRGGEGLTVLGWLLTTSDGTVMPLHPRAAPASTPGSAESESLAGTWVPQATDFAGLAAAARSWPVSDAGRAAAAATVAERDAARSACISFGPPALMSLPVTVIVELTDSAVSFRLDYMDARRVVHLDASEHPAALEPSLQGHSIGRWEGDTLVVDTIGYSPHPDGYAFDWPSSAAKHVVERFTLSADRRHIEYEAVVEDSEYFTAPVTHRSQWDYRPELTMSNLPCDMESARRFAEEP